MPRLDAVLRVLMVALLTAGLAHAAPEAEDAYHFIQDPADVGPDGALRPPGDRLPVVFVHGFMKDDLQLERKIHIVFSFLHGRFVKKVNRGEDPFEYVYPVHYRYRPDGHYRDLGKQFAERYKERFGEVPCILFVHSAGAMIGRWAADAGLLVLAMVGLAPAHGGSPGASLMYANRKLLTDGRVEEPHMEVVEKTLKEIGVPDPAARSLAWDNADGAIAPGDAKKYAVEIQPRLPDFRFDRFDHYGVLKHFVAPFAGFDFMGNSKARKKSDRELEWEVLGQYSEKWKQSDGVVVPYPPGPWDGDTQVWRRTYKGIGHREIFFDPEVLDVAWGQVQATAAHLLADGPSPFEAEPPATLVADAGGHDEPTPPEPTTPTEPADPGDEPPPEPTQVADAGGTGAGTGTGSEDDLDDLGGLDDLDDDLGDPTGDDSAGDDPGEVPGDPMGDDLGDDLDLDPDLAAPPAVRTARAPAAARPVAGPDGVDLRQVESSGLLPGPPVREAPRPGAALFGGWDPGRMTRWVDG